MCDGFSLKLLHWDNSSEDLNPSESVHVDIRKYFFAYWIRISANYTGASKSLSHTPIWPHWVDWATKPQHKLIHPLGKIKIENFTERYDVAKCHGIVIIIWQTSANLSDCIIKNPLSEMKGMQERESILCAGQIENSVHRDHSLTSLGKPCDVRQKPSGWIFLSTPHNDDRSLYV